MPSSHNLIIAESSSFFSWVEHPIGYFQRPLTIYHVENVYISCPKSKSEIFNAKIWFIYTYTYTYTYKSQSCVLKLLIKVFTLHGTIKIAGFHKALSCSRWWSTCSYQSEKIMFILFIKCSSLVFGGKMNRIEKCSWHHLQGRLEEIISLASEWQK